MRRQTIQSWPSAIVATAALILAIPLTGAEPAPAGRIALDKPGVDFGKVEQHTKLSHVVTVRNVGSGTLQIVAVMTGCKCAVAEMDSNEIPPGGRARIKFVFDTHVFEGPIHKTLTVRSSDPEHPLADFYYKADVQPVFVFSPRTLDFGEMEVGKNVAGEVTLSDAKRRKFTIKRIACADPNLKVEVSPSGRPSATHRLKVSFTPQHYSGPFYVRFIVETDREKDRDPSMLVTGTVVRAVRVEPTALFLGMVQQGEKFPLKTLRVQNKGPQPVEIRSVDPGDPAFAAVVTTNAPGREFSVDLTTREALAPGWIRRTLRIGTSDSNVPLLLVPVSGVVRATDGASPK